MHTYIRRTFAATTLGLALAATGSITATAASAADDEDRWQSTQIGSGAGSGTSAITENADGSITFDARDSGTKMATSEDGFLYYYTRIDPETENFTLDASFHVDDAAAKDSQSGFGIVAVDDMVPGSSADRYFNSAGTLLTRYGEGTGSTANGAPGGRFVTGYTGATDDNGAGSRDQGDSQLLDPEYRAERGSSPRFDTGDTYDLSLRRSNTGFHAIWHRTDAEGGDREVIGYDPDIVLQQDAEGYYVGLAVARKIKVTATDWDLTTIDPAADEPAQPRPTEYVPAELEVDVTDTTPGTTLEVPLVSNMHGTGQVLDAAGNVLADGIDLEPGERALVPVELEPGTNELTARLTPDAEQPQLEDWERVESTDPVDVAHTVTVRSYGEPGEAIRVSPDGSPDGDGTEKNPLDVQTAVDFAQAGQQIVLEGGTYALEHGLVVDRGRDGTAEAPITLMSEPGARAVFDLAGSDSGGLNLRGDHWHVYDLEVTGSQNRQKPVHIQGHDNVIEKLETHHNADTGLQISGISAEPKSMWPSNNLVVSSESHHNADEGGNDADGFGAKITVGEGNVFRNDIAHHNIDDGWDLFAKSTSGTIGVVTIEDSVAYENGFLTEDPSVTGEGNGFKLGGESMPGKHVLRNSLAYGNLGTGATSNSGPDVRLENVTTVANERGVRLSTNKEQTDYRASGVVSWDNAAGEEIALKQEDTSLLTDPTNYFDGATQDASDGRPARVTADWFDTTDASVAPEIAEDGSIDVHGLYALTGTAPADTGARLGGIEDPTEIEVFPTVKKNGNNGNGPGANDGLGAGAGNGTGYVGRD